MSTSRDDKLASMSPAPDPIAALRALSACLRHLACGYLIPMNGPQPSPSSRAGFPVWPPQTLT